MPTLAIEIKQDEQCCRTCAFYYPHYGTELVGSAHYKRIFKEVNAGHCAPPDNRETGRRRSVRQRQPLTKAYGLWERRVCYC